MGASYTAAEKRLNYIKGREVVGRTPVNCVFGMFSIVARTPRRQSNITDVNVPTSTRVDIIEGCPFQTH